MVDDERADGPASDEGTEPEEAQDAAPAEQDARPGARQQQRRSRSTLARSERRRRASRKASRRQWYVGIGGGTIALMLIAGLFLPSLGGLSRHIVPTDEADNTPLAGTALPVQPGGEIEIGAAHDAYSTQPPTSGPGYADAAPWGVHAAQIDDETVVRNLAMGAVVFNSNLGSEEQQADLRQLIESLPGYPGCYILHPYEGIPAGSVTMTAWGWTQNVTGADPFLIQTFADDHVNQGPQFLGPSCGAPPPAETPEEAPTPEEATPTGDAQQGE